MLYQLEWSLRSACRGLALVAALLGGIGASQGLVAQQAPKPQDAVNVGIVVVERHSTLNAPIVIVINPSWARSDAVVSIEADALDASAVERGLKTVQRALAGGLFADREDVILSVSTLQGSTREARAGAPSPVRERAERAVAHFAPLVAASRASEAGRRGEPAPGMDVLGVSGFIASMHMSFPRSKVSERGPRNPRR